MDDGGKVSSGMKLATNSLKYTEVLSSILNYQTSIISAGVPNQYNIYIPKKSMNKLIDIVGFYIHPSMKFGV